MTSSIFDFVVIGGGSAGCPIAARLSEDASLNILLLDAGKSDRHLYTRMPAGQMWAFSRPDMNWLYMAEPDPSRGGRVDMWPAGKRLGGGSAINGMMFVRGHASDYDQWAQMGNKGWSHDDVLPYFKRLETYEKGGDAARGGSGPLHVSLPRSPHPLCDAFIRAAGETGVEISEDLNGANAAEGAGYVQASQKAGWRQSTAASYIWPIEQSRTNLTISLESVVVELLFDGKRAVGVRYSRKGKECVALARHGVILSAGAIASPKLLMLSGVGPEEELNKHGIDVRHDLPGVGQNLMEHPGAGIDFEIDTPTLTSDLGIIKSPLHALNYIFKGRGPLATSIGHAQAFIKTRPGLSAPNIQIIFSPLRHTVEDGKAIPAKEPVMSLAVGLCRVNGRGELRLKSSNPADPPIIDHALLSDQDDLSQLAEGCAAAMKILHAPAFKDHLVRLESPTRDELSHEEWTQHVRDNAYLMYHASGTCRMGDDKKAVVDSNLRVRGMDNLWVADASVMPTLPAGNINATCIMIGEKAADLVRADFSKRT